MQKEKYINHNQTYSSQQTSLNEVIMLSVEFLPEEMIEHIASLLDNEGINYLRKTRRKLYQWIPFHLFQG
jgi:thymidine kinase